MNLLGSKRGLKGGRSSTLAARERIGISRRPQIQLAREQDAHTKFIRMKKSMSSPVLLLHKQIHSKGHIQPNASPNNNATSGNSVSCHQRATKLHNILGACSEVRLVMQQHMEEAVQQLTLGVYSLPQPSCRSMRNM